MSDATPVTPTAYPLEPTELEQVEIASALSFHFDHHPECKDEHQTQYMVVCAVVQRMLRRRAGLL